MSGEEEENAAELKIGDEFLKAKCLMNCEVSLILEHKFEQLQQMSDDPRNQVSHIYELQHLWYLRLSWCSSLFAFPSRMNSESSSSAGPLPLLLSTNHRTLDDTCGPAVSPCNSLPTLGSLNLSRCNFVCLPEWVSKCSNLWLDLSCCKRLREISELPPKLRWLSVSGCESLERLSIFSNLLEHNELPGLERIDLSHCYRLLDNLRYDSRKVDNAVRQSQVLPCMKFSVLLPGSKFQQLCNPSWRRFDEIVVEIPPPSKWKNTRLALCAVVGFMENKTGHGWFSVESCINHETIDDFAEICSPTDDSSTDHVWLRYISLEILSAINFDKMVKCRVTFFAGGCILLKKCGARLLSPQDDDDADDDEKDDEQWLPSTSLSLGKTNPRKRKHIHIQEEEEDHNLMAVNNTSANPPKDNWLSLS